MAFEPVRTYSPRDVTVTFGGYILSGFMDGDFVTFTPADDWVTMQTGADGTTSRTIKANRNGSVVVRLRQTSLSNDILMSFAKSEEIVRFQIKDLRGNTLISVNQAWVAKIPEVGFGEEAGGREWGIDLADPNIEIGGNN